jgi:hypothetical protein
LTRNGPGFWAQLGPSLSRAEPALDRAEPKARDRCPALHRMHRPFPLHYKGAGGFFCWCFCLVLLNQDTVLLAIKHPCFCFSFNFLTFQFIIGSYAPRSASQFIFIIWIEPLEKGDWRGVPVEADIVVETGRESPSRRESSGRRGLVPAVSLVGGSGVSRRKMGRTSMICNHLRRHRWSPIRSIGTHRRRSGLNLHQGT